ncbi:MAG: MBL fold metallo-hydrolase, partial [Treponemataceae bacterium]|nr:MBL fold metallo-hydrolase [Treponemataceae bacterium]
VSTYDAVALIIVNTWHKGKFQYVRIITDVICVLLGVALFLLSGGAVRAIITIAGAGTIITAFFMGPLIEFFNVHCARPVLNKGKKGDAGDTGTGATSAPSTQNQIIKINEDTYRIEDGGVRFYVFCGKEKAAVIDTGMNTPNAKELVQSITSLPLVLINTHADPDHISGNSDFDTVYMSPAEEENYRERGGTGSFIPVKEGDVIDLGGRSLFVIDIPGHTPGSIALLDEKNRILVSGDSVSNSKIFMFGKFRDLSLYVKSLEHLKNWDGKYDDVYPMHGDFPQKPEQVAKLIQGAREILEGKASATPVDMFGNKVMLYKFPYAGFLCEK